MNAIKSFFTAILAMFAVVWAVFDLLYQKAKKIK